MRRHLAIAIAATAAVAFALTGSATPARAAGTLNVLMIDDVDYIDPARTYYQVGFMFAFATQRPLYTSDGRGALISNLASSPPAIADDQRSVTVPLRRGVRFAPPVDREVTSADVKYAIERGFFRTVSNGYAGAYFGNLVGAEVGAAPGRRIRGIETPDAHTVVFHLDRPVAGTFARALILPLTAPVPRDYALAHDRKRTSTYGAAQTATGPFRLQSYRPGRSITLTRNPNWDPATDFRAPTVDRIVATLGQDDTTRAARRIVTGSAMVNGDFAPPPAELRRLVQSHPSQVERVSAGGTRYIALNTKVAPLNNLNVRRAVVAAHDRAALREIRGGDLAGDVPTHFIPPGVPGFEEAGGAAGPGYDFLANPAGDLKLARAYLRKAGYRSGRVTGRRSRILMVGVKDGPAEKVAKTSAQTFRRLGFRVRLRLVTQDAMYTRYCNVPRARVAVCPNVGWYKDFDDPMTVLDPTFNGRSILSRGNSNWSQLDVPQINRRLTAAQTIADPAARAREYGELDKLITAQAPAVPWLWDKDAQLRSADVTTPVDHFTGAFDLARASLAGG